MKRLFGVMFLASIFLFVLAGSMAGMVRAQAGEAAAPIVVKPGQESVVTVGKDGKQSISPPKTIDPCVEIREKDPNEKCMPICPVTKYLTADGGMVSCHNELKTDPPCKKVLELCALTPGVPVSGEGGGETPPPQTPPPTQPTPPQEKGYFERARDATCGYLWSCPAEKQPEAPVDTLTGKKSADQHLKEITKELPSIQEVGQKNLDEIFSDKPSDRLSEFAESARRGLGLEPLQLGPSSNASYGEWDNFLNNPGQYTPAQNTFPDYGRGLRDSFGPQPSLGQPALAGPPAGTVSPAPPGSSPLQGLTGNADLGGPWTPVQPRSEQFKFPPAVEGTRPSIFDATRFAASSLDSAQLTYDPMRADIFGPPDTGQSSTQDATRILQGMFGFEPSSVPGITIAEGPSGTFPVGRALGQEGPPAIFTTAAVTQRLFENVREGASSIYENIVDYGRSVIATDLWDKTRDSLYTTAGLGVTPPSNIALTDVPGVTIGSEMSPELQRLVQDNQRMAALTASVAEERRLSAGPYPDVYGNMHETRRLAEVADRIAVTHEALNARAYELQQKVENASYLERWVTDRDGYNADKAELEKVRGQINTSTAIYNYATQEPNADAVVAALQRAPTTGAEAASQQLLTREITALDANRVQGERLATLGPMGTEYGRQQQTYRELTTRSEVELQAQRLGINTGGAQTQLATEAVENHLALERARIEGRIAELSGQQAMSPATQAVVQRITDPTWVQQNTDNLINGLRRDAAENFRSSNPFEWVMGGAKTVGASIFSNVGEAFGLVTTERAIAQLTQTPEQIMWDRVTALPTAGLEALTFTTPRVIVTGTSLITAEMAGSFAGANDAATAFRFQPKFAAELTGTEARVVNIYAAEAERITAQEIASGAVNPAAAQARAYETFYNNLAKSDFAIAGRGDDVLNSLQAEMRARNFQVPEIPAEAPIVRVEPGVGPMETPPPGRAPVATAETPPAARTPVTEIPAAPPVVEVPAAPRPIVEAPRPVVEAPTSGRAVVEVPAATVPPIVYTPAPGIGMAPGTFVPIVPLTIGDLGRAVAFGSPVPYSIPSFPHAPGFPVALYTNATYPSIQPTTPPVVTFAPPLPTITQIVSRGPVAFGNNTRPGMRSLFPEAPRAPEGVGGGPPVNNGPTSLIDILNRVTGRDVPAAPFDPIPPSSIVQRFAPLPPGERPVVAGDRPTTLERIRDYFRNNKPSDVAIPPPAEPPVAAARPTPPAVEPPLPKRLSDDFPRIARREASPPTVTEGTSPAVAEKGPPPLPGATGPGAIKPFVELPGATPLATAGKGPPPLPGARGPGVVRPVTELPGANPPLAKAPGGEPPPKNDRRFALFLVGAGAALGTIGGIQAACDWFGYGCPEEVPTRVASKEPGVVRVVPGSATPTPPPSPPPPETTKVAGGKTPTVADDEPDKKPPPRTTPRPTPRDEAPGGGRTTPSAGGTPSPAGGGLPNLSWLSSLLNLLTGGALGTPAPCQNAQSTFPMSIFTPTTYNPAYPCPASVASPTTIPPAPVSQEVLSFICNPSVILNRAMTTVIWACPAGLMSRGFGFDTTGATSGFVNVPISTTNDAVALGVACGLGALKQCAVKVLHPHLTVVAAPNTVQSGSSANISWAGTEVVACAVLGSGSTEVGRGGKVGTIQTPRLTRSTRFSVFCSTEAGKPVFEKILIHVEGDTQLPTESTILANFMTSTPPSSEQTGDGGTTEPNPGTGTTAPPPPGMYAATDAHGKTVYLCDPEIGINKFITCISGGKY